VTLRRGAALRTGVPIEHVYFVEDGLVSVLASVGGSCVECG
jgi:hypothetical protein